jgi:hypothetical protein
MKSKHFSCVLFLLIIQVSLKSQSFEMDQIQQIWRPKIKADFSFFPSLSSTKNETNYSATSQAFLFTIPVKTKLGAEVNLNLSSFNLKDILKNSISIKASQLLASCKVSSRQVNWANERFNFYNVYGGIFGLKLSKKFNVTFYSVNAGYSEQDKTLNQIKLRMSGVIGNFKLLGLRKNYYYGVSAIWSDGIFLPLPFFGGTLPVNEKITFSFTLPAQAYLLYSINNKHAVSSGLSLDGYRTGYKITQERYNLNYYNLNVFVNYRVKLNQSFGLRVQGGYVVLHQLSQIENNTNYSQSLRPGFYAEAGIYTYFGRSLWDQVNGTLSDVLSKIGDRN